MTNNKTTTLDRIEPGKGNAEVVFIRKDESGREYRIYGCKCYESWEQWGAPREILADNCDDIENWRNP